MYENTYPHTGKLIHQYPTAMNPHIPTPRTDRYIEQAKEFPTHQMEVISLGLSMKRLEEELVRADELIAELKEWKRQAMEVMPDFQAVGHALNLPLGTPVHEHILPAILELQAHRRMKNPPIEFPT
jgi:hypothetical protein